MAYHRKTSLERIAILKQALAEGRIEAGRTSSAIAIANLLGCHPHTV